MKTITLNCGTSIPAFGYGTWQTPPSVCREATLCALQTGFRHIDTASLYGNEAEVGQAVQQSGVPREQLFITTKVWNTERGYGRTLRSFQESLDKLGMEYVDLFLIHWPAVSAQYNCWKELNAETWKAMEELFEQGRARAIGVSNFMPRHLEPLLDSARIVPAVNQIEYHPGWMQRECVDFCSQRGIAVEAWSPLANGDAFKMPLLQELSGKYGRSISQIVLQWVMSHGVIPLSKSVTPSRIAENFASTGFTLSAEDIARIDALEPCGGKCRNPDIVKY